MLCYMLYYVVLHYGVCSMLEYDVWSILDYDVCSILLMMMIYIVILYLHLDLPCFAALVRILCMETLFFWS